MYYTRRFKISQEAEYKALIDKLKERNIEYEVLKLKKIHMNTTPQNQKFRAIVSWADVQVD